MHVHLKNTRVATHKCKMEAACGFAHYQATVNYTLSVPRGGPVWSPIRGRPIWGRLYKASLDARAPVGVDLALLIADVMVAKSAVQFFVPEAL